LLSRCSSGRSVETKVFIGQVPGDFLLGDATTSTMMAAAAAVKKNDTHYEVSQQLLQDLIVAFRSPRCAAEKSHSMARPLLDSLIPLSSFLFLELEHTSGDDFIYCVQLFGVS
jgi:hypothetical protein